MINFGTPRIEGKNMPFQKLINLASFALLCGPSLFQFIRD